MKHWRDYLTVIFFLLFIAFLYYFYINVETIKENPCKLCVESYNLICTDGKGLVLQRGYDWDGSERLKEMYKERDSVYSNLSIPNLSELIKQSDAFV